MADPVHIVLCEKHNPIPPDHGRATRIVTLAAALRKRGFRVTILACDGVSKTLPDGTRIRAIPPFPWPLREIVLWSELRRISREQRVDVFQVQNDVFVIAALLAKLSGFRVTYDAQVVERDFWKALRAGSIREAASAKIMPVCELLLCWISERVSVLSHHDAQRLALAHRLPAEKVVVVPLSAPRPSESKATTESESGPRTVLFLGSYAHRPNADAIALIGKEIRPRVLRQVSDATFRIVGKGLPTRALAAEGFEVFSDVDDVTPFIDSATVCIAPLKVGSGVRVKLIEYLSRGKPVVAMTPALEGLQVRPGIDLLVADDVDSFAASVIGLLNDPAARERLGSSGFERILELTGEEAVSNALSGFYAARPPA